MKPLETQELARATRERLAAMDKWDAERERTLLVEGGRVKNASGSWTSVRWAMRVPNMSELDRLGDELAHRIDTLEKIRTGIRPTRNRARPRANHERARAAFEASGADAINGYQSTAKRQPVALRIFYRSAGGEILACESDPMTCADAERTAGPSWARFGWALSVEIVPASPKSLHAIRELAIPSAMRDAMASTSDVKPWREALKLIPTHARFVVFPSQHERANDEAPRACGDCGSPELCLPECSIAPWNQ